MVKTLHEAGIEVILDVVYNHTAEGGAGGPVLSFRGLDNQAYYRLDPADPTPVRRLHRHRQQPEHAPPPRAAADHGQPPVLDPGDARRRVPVRPRGHARPRAARRRPALGVLRPHPAGPGRPTGQADRRAVGRGRGRLPGRQLPAVVVGVERSLPRQHPRRLARPRRRPQRVRLAGHRLVGPVRGRRSAAPRQHQLRHRPRRVHARRPRHLQRQAQRGERRGRPRRHRRQPVVELRGRGPDRRPADQRAAGPPAAEPARHAPLLPGSADVGRGRRDGSDPGRQQQRVRARQRGVVGALGRDRTRTCSSSPDGSSPTGPPTRSSTAAASSGATPPRAMRRPPTTCCRTRPGSPPPEPR